MPSSIHLRCSSCNGRIKAPVALIGQTRKCPGCGQPVQIRRAPLQDAPPLLVSDDRITLQPAAATPGEEKLILVVDDDRELNDGLRCLLEKQGHRVIQAFDGVEAQEVICRQAPDLMILDMMMPRQGGFPILEYLGLRAEAPPVIMITGQDGKQHQAYAESLGVVAYLKKPFAMDRLLESVDKGLVGQHS
jgi:CheY-like chemotaxis protein